jgi:hypothetical protein
LVNHLDAEVRSGRQGRTPIISAALDFVILDELGFCPSPRPAASCCST